MFEKEAYDYSIDTYETCLYDNLPYVNDSRAREEAFKDGAEFGYNKCNTELTKAKELIQDLIDSLEVIDGEQIRELKVVKEAEQFLKED